MNWYWIAKVIDIKRIDDWIDWLPIEVVVGICYVFPSPVDSLNGLIFLNKMRLFYSNEGMKP